MRPRNVRPWPDDDPDWVQSGSTRSHPWFASAATLMPSANASLIRFTESPLERTGWMATWSRCLVSVFRGVESQEGSERRQSLGGAACRADGRDPGQIGASARGATLQGHAVSGRAVRDEQLGMIEGSLFPAHPLVGQCEEE